MEKFGPLKKYTVHTHLVENLETWYSLLIPKRIMLSVMAVLLAALSVTLRSSVLKVAVRHRPTRRHHLQCTAASFCWDSLENQHNSPQIIQTRNH
jgi:hypothetical protein